MQINADLTQGVVVDTNSLEWEVLAETGAARRLLDHDDGGLGRATSIVRYAPGNSFPTRECNGGEELFVLEGSFSDECGDYSVGTYVRNPIGSFHASFTSDGCTLLVKRGQITDSSNQRLVVDTSTIKWQPTAIPGLKRLPIFASDVTGESVYLARFAPGVINPGDTHPRGEEVLVLEGTLEDEYGTYPKGTWLRQPDGSSHSPYSRTGCTLWIKRGHLPPLDIALERSRTGQVSGDAGRNEPYPAQETVGKRAWCSCGRSRKQPYCDGSHKGTAYRPIVVNITEARQVLWCGCKQSGEKPYCDGTHLSL